MKRIINAIKYSISGIIASHKTEAAFRQEIVIFIVCSLVVTLLNVEILHKIIMMSSILLILITELINSAIEATVNRVSIKIHPLSKKAKDAASAAVFLSFINAIFVWTAILI